MRYEFAEFRATLEAIGMTQAEFADLTGSTAQRVTKWRAAKRGVPYWVRSWLMMWRTCARATRDEIRGNSAGAP